MSKIDRSKIFIRELKESDIESAVNYWCDPSEETIYPLLKDELKGDKEGFQKIYTKLATELEYANFSRVIEYDGQSVGTINLTDIKDNRAHLHAHFWNKAWRGQGLAIAAGPMAALWLIEANNLEGLYLIPPNDNPMSSRIPQKLGLKALEENTELSYSMICDGIRGDIFYISKEDVQKLCN